MDKSTNAPVPLSGVFVAVTAHVVLHENMSPSMSKGGKDL